MKQAVYKNDFIREMSDIRPENFSYDGLEALFNYLEELEDDYGEEIEFDPIALCCEFTEHYILDWLRETFTDDEIDEVIDLLVDDWEDFMDDGEELESIGEIIIDMIDYEKVEKRISYHTTFIKIDDENFIVGEY